MVSNITPGLAIIANARMGGKPKKLVTPTHLPRGPLKRHTRLLIPATLQVGDEPEISVSLFIDTGSEVDLVRAGVVPSFYIKPAKRPLHLWAANAGQLPGGKSEVLVNLRIVGYDVEQKSKVAITTPTLLYEATAEDDVMLSLLWLAERGFDVCADRHGLMGHVDGRKVWVGGLEEEHLEPLGHQPVCVRACPVTAGRRALDLFCGQKSAAKVLEKHGFHVETLDNDPSRDPSICIDIMEWDYVAAYPPRYFTIIVAAPPCTEYSAAKWRPPRQPEKADPVVKRTLEIIHYFQPDRWWLETPRNGELARRDFMQSYPFVDCDHCQFEERGYQKPTRFFGSDHLRSLRPVLCDGRTCTSLEAPGTDATKRHLRHRNRLGGNQGSAKKEVTYYIPPELVEYVSGFQVPSPGTDAECRQGTVATIGTQEDCPEYYTDPHKLELLERVRCMRLRADPDSVDFADENPDEDDEVLWEVARRIEIEEKKVSAVVEGDPPTRSFDWVNCRAQGGSIAGVWGHFIIRCIP